MPRDDARNSGDASRSLASPKLNLALGPWARTELYGSFGGGFHSNDARGATITIDPVTGEPAEGIDDAHFHPVQPRTFRFLASWRR